MNNSAYGPEIARLLEREAGREVSRGALYSSLSRLERKGHLSCRVEPGTPERGGHRKRVFTVTPFGVSALREARAALLRLSSGLEELLSEVGS